MVQEGFDVQNICGNKYVNIKLCNGPDICNRRNISELHVFQSSRAKSIKSNHRRFYKLNNTRIRFYRQAFIYRFLDILVGHKNSCNQLFQEDGSSNTGE